MNVSLAQCVRFQNWCALHSIEIVSHTNDSLMQLKHPRFTGMTAPHVFFKTRNLAYIRMTLQARYEWLR